MLLTLIANMNSAYFVLNSPSMCFKVAVREAVSLSYSYGTLFKTVSISLHASDSLSNKGI